MLDALLVFAPTHARALAAKALALKDLDRLDEALDWARRAAAAAPDAPESHNALGQVHQAMGDFDAALASYERASGLAGPARLDAIANRGSLFVEHGRRRTRSRRSRPPREAFPNSPGILFGQTELRTFTPDDPLIGRMRALLGREGISLSDRVTLHFGLAKTMLDIGDSAAAFQHYDEGNRLKRSTFDFEIAATESFISSIAAAFPASLLEARRTPARAPTCRFSLSACRAPARR